MNDFPFKWRTFAHCLAVLVVLGIVFYTATESAAQTTDSKAQEPTPTLSAAVLPFAFSTEPLEDISAEFPTLLTAYLSAEPSLIMVERAEVDKALSEAELSLSGTVDSDTTAKVGHLIGARVLISGRVFPVQRQIIAVAKIIGVETGRVYGSTVTFPPRGSVVDAAQELAGHIGQSVSQNGASLIARLEPKEDLVSRLRQQVDGKKLPSVSINIPEQSLSRNTIDPAAETEIGYILQQLGFEVIDPLATNKSPNVEITGEAFSEMGLRQGNLVSSKGRVELKVVDRTGGKVLLVTREVAVAVDIAPEIAGKAAIAKSAKKLIEQLVPALLKAEVN